MEKQKRGEKKETLFSFSGKNLQSWSKGVKSPFQKGESA